MCELECSGLEIFFCLGGGSLVEAAVFNRYPSWAPPPKVAGSLKGWSPSGAALGGTLSTVRKRKVVSGREKTYSGLGLGAGPPLRAPMIDPCLYVGSALPDLGFPVFGF